MDYPTEGPVWDAERERMEGAIRSALHGRADQQGWINAKGKLTAKGHTAALEFIIGMASAFDVTDHPAKKWMLNQAFLCAVRGVNDRFPFLP